MTSSHRAAAATQMHAWAVTPGWTPGTPRLRRLVLPVPVPAPDELLVRVVACGVCRTDLHLAEGDLGPRLPGCVPGHEVVGRVVGRGADVRDFLPGDRVGIAWLRGTCGHCRWCRSGRENLCAGSSYTGWSGHGGFAELVTVPRAWAYRVPIVLEDVAAAPLLCAGTVGFRALERCGLPPGGRLGLYGFGASAHLTVQIALARGAQVHVVTRAVAAQRLALELGAATARPPSADPPVSLDAAIVFTPSGETVRAALGALGRGGTVVVAGIHLSDIPGLVHCRHLSGERSLTSVTAATRVDGEQLLVLAARLGIRARTTTYPFAEAPRALDDLAEGRVVGAAVLSGSWDPGGDLPAPG